MTPAQVKRATKRYHVPRHNPDEHSLDNTLNFFLFEQLSVIGFTGLHLDVT